MKVLHLLQSNRFSGAENVVCQIIKMLDNHPDIEMVYSSRDGQIREALAEKQIKFAPMTKLCAKELKRVIKEEKPDVIHAHDMRASFVAARVCGKIPLISHIHNNAVNSRGVSAKSILYWFAAKKAKHIFWVSKSSYEGYAFHKSFAKKSTVLYNVIDVDELYKKMQTDTNEYDYDVVYVGRLGYPKNPKRMVEVLSSVVKKRPQTKAAVVGVGDSLEEIKEIAAQRGADKNIDFLGYKTNPLKIMYNAKLMIMTSIYEGTPMVALEALALGLPIVSTPVDGLKDLIVDEKNGLLVDDDGKMCEFIEKVLNDKAFADELSAYAKEQSVKLNDISKYRDTLLKVYLG